MAMRMEVAIFDPEAVMTGLVVEVVVVVVVDGIMSEVY